MPEPKRPLKVFLCHAHADRDSVRKLYSRLTQDGVDAWFDKAKLLPGQDWELEIRKAVREADVVVVCLSKQFNQAGFRQKEVRLALDTAMEKPEGEIFIIPARLEECDNLESLRKWHWVDLFEDNGYEMLMRALRPRWKTENVIKKILRNALTEKNLSNTARHASKRRKEDGFLAILIEHPDYRTEFEEAVKGAGAIPIYERNREVIVIDYKTLLIIAENMDLLETDPAKLQTKLKKLCGTKTDLEGFLKKDIKQLTWDDARSALNSVGAKVISETLPISISTLFQAIFPFLAK